MTVEEIKAKLPEADIYCLDENSRYLIVVDRYFVSLKAIDSLLSSPAMPKNVAVLAITGPAAHAVSILEMKKEMENGPQQS